METQAAGESLAERARRSKRRGRLAAEVPLGVKLLAILTFLNGIWYLLSVVIFVLDPDQWEGSVAANLLGNLVGVILGGALGVLLLWWGRSLYGGSRIALDILIGVWGATLIFNAFIALAENPLWTVLFPLIFYGGIVFYLVRCRPALVELEKARSRGKRHRVRRTASSAP